MLRPKQRPATNFSTHNKCRATDAKEAKKRLERVLRDEENKWQSRRPTKMARSKRVERNNAMATSPKELLLHLS